MRWKKRNDIAANFRKQCPKLLVEKTLLAFVTHQSHSNHTGKNGEVEIITISAAGPFLVFSYGFMRTRGGRQAAVVSGIGNLSLNVAHIFRPT